MAFVNFDTIDCIPIATRTPTARMTRKNWGPWKTTIIEMAAKGDTYELISQALAEQGLHIAPKMIGHHLRRWGLRKNRRRKPRSIAPDQNVRARQCRQRLSPAKDIEGCGGSDTAELDAEAGQPNASVDLSSSEVIPVHPPVSGDDHEEHRLLSGIVRWFQGFGESDPRGLTLHNTSRLDLAMMSFAQYIHLAVAKGHGGAWDMLRKMPSTLDNAFEDIFPDTFSTVVIHLLNLRNAEAVFSPVVDFCLDRVARTSHDKLGVNHPLVGLFPMAAKRRLTLRVCSRLWTIMRREHALTDEENEMKWKIRQNHGFGMVLYQFGQRHQANEHLRVALESAQSIDSSVDRAYILTDMELTATDEWDYRSMQGYIERDERRILSVVRQLQLGVWRSAAYRSTSGEYERRKKKLDYALDTIRIFHRKHQLNIVEDEDQTAYPFNSSFMRRCLFTERRE